MGGDVERSWTTNLGLGKGINAVGCVVWLALVGLQRIGVKCEIKWREGECTHRLALLRLGRGTGTRHRVGTFTPAHFCLVLSGPQADLTCSCRNNNALNVHLHTRVQVSSPAYSHVSNSVHVQSLSTYLGIAISVLLLFGDPGLGF